jgi:hypothetical protein
MIQTFSSVEAMTDAPVCHGIVLSAQQVKRLCFLQLPHFSAGRF